MQPLKILALMSQTGNGHVSAAKALQEAFHTLYPGEVNVKIIEVFNSKNPNILDKITKLYEPTILNAPKLWGLAFRLTNSQTAIRSMAKAAKPTIGKRLQKIINKEKPDAIISVHPLANHITLDSLKSLNLSIPFFTCLTDLVDVHAGWVTKNNLIFAPTEKAKKGLLEQGVLKSNINILGLPIQNKFSMDFQNQNLVRKKLKLDPNLFCAFMVGGGAGAGELLEKANTISNAKLNLQLIVACGRNQDLKEKFEKECFNMPVKILGFADNVHELIYASNVVISKAGSLTTAESLSLGKPIILINVLPGQEDGNPILLKKVGAGIRVKTSTELVKNLQNLLNNPGKLEKMSKAAFRLGRPNASKEIAQKIYSILRYN